MEIKKSKDEKKKELELYSYAAPPKGIEEGNGRDYFESIKGVCSDNVATLLISVLLAAVSTYVSWSARVLTPNIEVEGNFSPGSIYAAAAAVVAALSIPMLLQIQSNLQEIDSLDLSNHSGGNLAGRGHSINGGGSRRSYKNFI